MVRAIPKSLVRFFANPYVAGASLDEALSVAAYLWAAQDTLSTLDLLAEKMKNPNDLKQIKESYISLLNRIDNDPRFRYTRVKPSVSLKPSSFTLDPLDFGGRGQDIYPALKDLAAIADSKNIPLTVDMENHHWTDFTLDLVRKLHRQGYTQVGSVIQTRLHRSEQDLWLLPPRSRVRLVIGVYPEDTRIALSDKKIMKQKMVLFSEILLRHGHYVELATHDEKYIEIFLEQVIKAQGISRQQFEIQMLYGVPCYSLQRKLIRQKIQVRLYVPYSLSWEMALAYLRRRLDEYPAIMWLVIKNMFKLSPRAITL